MTENGEQYTFSNIIYIKFQNCCFFTMMSTLNKVLLTVDRSIERCLPGSSFFRHNCILGICNFTKDSPLYMYFPSFLLRFQICSNLWRVFRHFTNFCFPKNLLMMITDRHTHPHTLFVHCAPHFGGILARYSRVRIQWRHTMTSLYMTHWQYFIQPTWFIIRHWSSLRVNLTYW